MSIVQELLGNESFESFAENYLHKQPYAAPDTAKRFAGLIGWQLLNEIFLSEHDDCWLPKYGNLPRARHLASGYLTLNQAKNSFSQGHTVLVRHAELAHEKLAPIADDFRKFFKSEVDIQLYCTPQGHEGFDWHYDVENVFVIQSQGEKEFRLLPNSVTPMPLPMMSKENAFEYEKRLPEIRCHLCPGDWLYIPAGYWHKAAAVTDSFHLSVGVI